MGRLQQPIYSGARVPSQEGGIVGIWNNLLNKDWVEMCRTAYSQAAVTDEHKTHGVKTSGEDLPTGWMGWRKQGMGGYWYEGKVGLALTYVGIREY